MCKVYNVLHVHTIPHVLVLNQKSTLRGLQTYVMCTTKVHTAYNVQLVIGKGLISPGRLQINKQEQLLSITPKHIYIHTYKS